MVASNKMTRRGFTLLELLVVLTLMTVTIGIATISVGGMTDQARIYAAATRIGTAYRLAAFDSARSGLPHMLQLDRKNCRVAQPVWREEAWSWSSGPSFEMPGKVRLVGVKRTATTDEELMIEPPWQIAVPPGVRNVPYAFVLRVGNRVQGLAVIDALTGTPTVRMVNSD